MAVVPRFFVGIDPSINHTGWAVVEFDGESPSLLSSGVILLDPKDEDQRYLDLFRDLIHSLVKFRVSGRQIVAIIEKTHYEEKKTPKQRTKEIVRMIKQYVADAISLDDVKDAILKHFYEDKMRGIFKLVTASGVCIAACTALGMDVALITAKTWKPPKKKYKIRERVEEIFPKKKDDWVREDEYEAAGLALWGRAKWGLYDILRIQ